MLVRGWLVALGIAAALVAGGCGGDDEETGGGGEGAQEQTTLRVGVIPIADVAPLYLGIDQGTVKSRLSRAREALRAQLGDRP